MAADGELSLLASAEDGTLRTFYAMERRRMKRVLNGRVRRKGAFSHTAEAFHGLILLVLLAQILQLRVPDGLEAFRWIPDPSFFFFAASFSFSSISQLFFL